MKKVLLTLSLVCLFVACKDKNDASDLETRALALGYKSVAEYVEAVKVECQNNRHENCEILADSTHTACLNPNHGGVNCNGESHRGGNHNGGSNGGHHGNQNGGQGNGQGNGYGRGNR